MTKKDAKKDFDFMKKLVESNNISSRSIALKTGIDRQNISRILKGLNVPSYSRFYTIYNAIISLSK